MDFSGFPCVLVLAVWLRKPDGLPRRRSHRYPPQRAPHGADGGSCRSSSSPTRSPCSQGHQPRRAPQHVPQPRNSERREKAKAHAFLCRAFSTKVLISTLLVSFYVSFPLDFSKNIFHLAEEYSFTPFFTVEEHSSQSRSQAF